MIDELEVSTVEAFKALDEGEVLIGYMDGFVGRSLPKTMCTPSYRHGWRAGMVDSGRFAASDAARELAEDFKRRRLPN